jgi:hypothetical protein
MHRARMLTSGQDNDDAQRGSAKKAWMVMIFSASARVSDDGSRRAFGGFIHRAQSRRLLMMGSHAAGSFPASCNRNGAMQQATWSIWKSKRTMAFLRQTLPDWTKDANKRLNGVIDAYQDAIRKSPSGDVEIDLIVEVLDLDDRLTPSSPRRCSPRCPI